MVTGLVQQIAEVLAAHERTGPPLGCICVGRRDYRCVCRTWEECECGAVMLYGEHPAHIAELLVANLALREERATIGSICDLADPGIPQRRWVSGWVPTPTEEAEKSVSPDDRRRQLTAELLEAVQRHLPAEPTQPPTEGGSDASGAK